jgi:hypothetical protein
MKKILLIGAAVAGITLSAASAQSFSYNSGDALLLFKSSGGTGASQNVLINLGSLAAGFSSFSIDQSANSSLLSTVYGSDWYTAGNVSFGLIASDDDSLKLTLATYTLPTLGIKGQYLNTINANVNSLNAAALNGGTYQDVTDSGSRALNSAYFDNTVSGSVTLIDQAGFGYFGSSILSIAGPLYIDTYTYTTFSGIDTPSNIGTVNINNGVISVNSVPEPSTYALLGFGALLLVVAYRRANA